MKSMIALALVAAVSALVPLPGRVRGIVSGVTLEASTGSDDLKALGVPGPKKRGKRESWDDEAPVRATRQIPRHRRLANKDKSRKQNERLEAGEKGSTTRLRIIAGSARGRKLDSPETLLRPMMGKVREALFSTLFSMGVFAAPRRVNVMDCFCGSGSVGCEALSRGADRVAFVDMSRDACDVAVRNAKVCGFDGRGSAVCSTAQEALATPALHDEGLLYDVVTLTPPYEEISYPELVDCVAESKLLANDCVVVVEYPIELGTLPPKLGARDQLVGLRNRKYGRTILAFYAYKPTGKLNLSPRPGEFEGF